MIIQPHCRRSSTVQPFLCTAVLAFVVLLLSVFPSAEEGPRRATLTESWAIFSLNNGKHTDQSHRRLENQLMATEPVYDIPASWSVAGKLIVIYFLQEGDNNYHDVNANILGRSGTEAAVVLLEKSFARLGTSVITVVTRLDGLAAPAAVMASPWNNIVYSSTFEDGVTALGLDPLIVPDTIVLVAHYHCSPLAGLARDRFPKSTIVSWLNNHFNYTSSEVARNCFRHVDEIAANSKIAQKVLLEYLQQFLPTIPTIRTHTLYNPLRESESFYRMLRTQSVVDPFQIICTGKQNITVLQDILQQLHLRDPRFRMIIAVPAYRAVRSNDWNLDGFLGHVDHPQLMQIMAKSVLAFDHTKFAESFGYVFAEPNLLGVPVVTNQVPFSAVGELLANEPENEILDFDATSEEFVETIIRVQRCRMSSPQACSPSNERMLHLMGLKAFVTTAAGIFNITISH